MTIGIFKFYSAHRCLEPPLQNKNLTLKRDYYTAGAKLLWARLQKVPVSDSNHIQTLLMRCSEEKSVVHMVFIWSLRDGVVVICKFREMW